MSDVSGSGVSGSVGDSLEDSVGGDCPRKNSAGPHFDEDDGRQISRDTI